MFLGWRGQLILKRLKQVWNVGMLCCSDLMEKAIWQGTGRGKSLERVSGFERQWCRARESKRLHSLEGNIWSESERDGEGEVERSFLLLSTSISQCFSPRLSLRTSPLLPFKRLSLHWPLYMWQKAFAYTHTYHVCALTVQKETAGFPWRPLVKARDFQVLLTADIVWCI